MTLGHKNGIPREKSVQLVTLPLNININIGASYRKNTWKPNFMLKVPFMKQLTLLRSCNEVIFFPAILWIVLYKLLIVHVILCISLGLRCMIIDDKAILWNNSLTSKAFLHYQIGFYIQFGSVDRRVCMLFLIIYEWVYLRYICKQLCWSCWCDMRIDVFKFIVWY